MHAVFLKWSRKLHKWLGIYVALLTVIWIGELILLPITYPVDRVQESRVQPGHEAMMPTERMAWGELLGRLDAGEYGSLSSNVEISYFPRDGKYVVRDWDAFSVSTIDAADGRLLGRELDGNALFARKSGLVWLDEAVGAIAKAPFEVSFIILAVTGIYLVVFPYLRRKKALAEGILGLSPGDRFRFESTRHPEDMARIAALGLLPGVNATVMRIPRRGPVVLSARSTRIAVARNVAASFLFERVEA